MATERAQNSSPFSSLYHSPCMNHFWTASWTHPTNLPAKGSTYYLPTYNQFLKLEPRLSTMNWLQSTLASVKVYALNANHAPQTPLSVNYFPHRSVLTMASINWSDKLSASHFADNVTVCAWSTFRWYSEWLVIQTLATINRTAHWRQESAPKYKGRCVH